MAIVGVWAALLLTGPLFALDNNAYAWASLAVGVLCAWRLTRQRTPIR